VFVRDPSNTGQKDATSQEYVDQLRRVANVVEVHTMHQKIVVIDVRLVLLGSLNVLSQSNGREVMLVRQGECFARKLLDHEQARTFAKPPACGKCGSAKIDLRRTRRRTGTGAATHRSPNPSRTAGRIHVAGPAGWAPETETAERLPGRPTR
jgi:phosphatidylserine/phosphatidylglycerophosphate/cardiolipin synthase-like enzyme